MTVPHHNRTPHGIDDEQSISVGLIRRETISQAVYDKDIRDTLLNLGIMEKEHKAEMIVLRLRQCNLRGRR